MSGCSKFALFAVLSAQLLVSQQVARIDLDKAQNLSKNEMFDWSDCEGKRSGRVADDVSSHPALVRFTIVKVEPSEPVEGRVATVTVLASNLSGKEPAFLAINSDQLKVAEQEVSDVAHFGSVALEIETGDRNDLIHIGHGVWVEGLESREPTRVRLDPKTTERLELSGIVRCNEKAGCGPEGNSVLKVGWTQSFESFTRSGCSLNTFSAGDFKAESEPFEIRVHPRESAAK